MNITPKGSNPLVPSSQPNQSKAADARARAISMLSGAQAVPDQSNIAPEMMSAVAPPSPTVNEELLANEPDPVEVPPEEPKEETPQVSSQLALLARREKALRAKQQQQEQAIKAREDALKAKEEQLLAKEREYSNGYMPKDFIKQNPLKVLAEAGVSYDDLTQQVLNQSQTNPYTEAQIAKLEAQIARLTEEAENSKKQYSSQQEQAVEAAMKQIKMDVRQLVSKDPSYETIKATNSIDDVADLIRQTYEKDGYIMSVEDAAQEVEDYLIEEALKLDKIQKIQQRRQQSQAQPSNAPTTVNVKQTQGPLNKQPQQMKTLTNQIASSRPLSARERAILVFKGENK